MNLLVLNAGSSSLKYQFYRWPTEVPLCGGLVERVGSGAAILTHKIYDPDAPGEPPTEHTTTQPLPDHEAALLEVLRLLTAHPGGVIADPAEVAVVGHRVVHGGEDFDRATLITPEVEAKIAALAGLAPLHQPANLLGIEVARRVFGQARQVAVFDTAFHQTLPAYAYRYALPDALYTEQRIRKYGFHGTSHQYVAAQAAAYLGNSDARLVTIHLGNGCSMAAVRAGRSVDTSMGFGPLAGLVMGTRSGDLDPAILLYLADELGYSAAQLGTLLNKESGMLGLAGASDLRDVTRALDAGDARARLAYDVYAYRIRLYLGAYVAVLGGLDAVVFTAGVGENDPLVRQQVCAGLEVFGLALNEAENQRRAPGLRDLSAPGARAKILVIPTQEELEIARQCAELVG